MFLFLLWCPPALSCGLPVLEGSKFLLVKCSPKSVVSTRPKVMQVLCRCQKGKLCLHLLLRSQHQCSRCLPASSFVLTRLKAVSQQLLGSWIEPRTAHCAFTCRGASKPKGGKTAWGDENERAWFG